MKKLLLILAIALFAGSVLTSCKSNKPPCPAYKSFNYGQQQMDDNNNHEEYKP